jgi:hypothetical protein
MVFLACLYANMETSRPDPKNNIILSSKLNAAGAGAKAQLSGEPTGGRSLRRESASGGVGVAPMLGKVLIRRYNRSYEAYD